MPQQLDSGSNELAELFDLDYGDFGGDLPFYKSLAQQAGGRILELGVGTGRVALHLARSGHQVTGIDQTTGMLVQARSKAAGLANIELVPGDIRNFSFDQSFALIYAGYGAFHHLLTTQDQLACLRSVEANLTAGGLLVFDLRAIFATDWEDGDSVPLLHDWTRVLDNGETVTKLRSVRVDRATQVQHETYFFDRVVADGSMRRVTTNVDLRFSTRYEVEWLLREAGLELEHLYGDYALSPYDGDSELMITVARKKTAR